MNGITIKYLRFNKKISKGDNFMKKRLALLLIVTLTANLMLFVGCAGKVEEEEFPSEAITLIVNYGGGGSTDLSSRALAKAAEEHLKVPISIVNKSGGSGTTGVIEVQNSKSDGYTIGVLTYSPLAIVPHQMEVPYTPDDFKYIIGYGEYRYGIAVKNDSPYKTIEDLVEAAKAEEGGLAFSASGFPQPFVMEEIGKKEGVEFNYVPFKSGSEAVTAVLGGHVEATVGIISSVVPFLETGEMRLLASASGDRWEQAPDAPTLKELGYDIAIQSYMGIGAPKDVSDEKIAIISEAFRKAFEDAEFQDLMKKINIPSVYKSGEEYKELVNKGYEENKKLIEEMNTSQ